MLSDAPVVAGIPFARRGREDLGAQAAELVAAGHEDDALVLLLGDVDDWWPWDVPSPAERRRALSAPTLRAAMDALGYGPVADYFAYRWSDPTFLSGLALLDARARGAQSLVEVGCGIGAFLREAALRGADVVGTDVVFSKLWLCRRFVCPSARLLCMDARDPLPLGDGSVDVGLCHDALHYVPDHAAVVAELRRVARTVLLGHVHVAGADNLSPGAPPSLDALRALLPDAHVYDDDALARALVAGEAAAPLPATDPADAPAVALAAGPASRGDGAPYAVPPPGAPVRVNPLLELGEGDPVPLTPRWPSDRYREEYAALSPHLEGTIGRAELERGGEEAVRRRVLVSLPEAW